MTESQEKPAGDSSRQAEGGYWQSRFRGLLQVGAGNMFASSVIAGLLIGFLVDRWLGTAPLFMLAVGALGFVGGMRNAKRTLMMQDRSADHPDDERDS
jgi:F0F1-type ATP synthase assembly protein I